MLDHPIYINIQELGLKDISNCELCLGTSGNSNLLSH